MVTIPILPACFKKLLVPRTRQAGFHESPDAFAQGTPECCGSTMLILLVVFMAEHSRLLLSRTGWQG